MMKAAGDHDTGSGHSRGSTKNKTPIFVKESSINPILSHMRNVVKTGNSPPTIPKTEQLIGMQHFQQLLNSKSDCSDNTLNISPAQFSNQHISEQTAQQILPKEGVHMHNMSFGNVNHMPQSNALPK